MKVASIGLYNPIPVNTGSDSYITHLLNSIGTENEITHYYCSKSNSKKGRTPKTINFKTAYIKSRFIKNKSYGKISKIFQIGRPDLFFDRSFISKIKADIVLCDTITYRIGKYISNKNKSPLVLIKHDIVWKKLKSDGSKFYLPMKIYEKSIFKKVDAITTISMADYQYSINYANEKNVHYLPPGLDMDIFTPRGRSFNFGNDKLNLLFYGSLDRPMNIEALKFIKEKLIPLLQKKNLLEKVRINIFGSGIPPKHLQIEENKNINFLGIVENPGEYIRGADLILVPVKNLGGTKIRVLEVLFCGKSAIVTPEVASGLPDELKDFVYIENEEKGFLKVIKQVLKNHSAKKTSSKTIRTYISKIKTMNDVLTFVMSNNSFIINKEGK